jgi:uncharacterized membrane protein YfcA
MTNADLLLLFVAAGGAGAVNALAGGGTLISVPVLLALGTVVTIGFALASYYWVTGIGVKG